jgi:thiol-disulfide isomerase/thioredoxin
MAETASTMLALGTEIPDFSLPDVVSGKEISPSDYDNKKALLVMFICNHCPFVKHVMQEIGRVAKDYQPKGVGVVAINSNDVKAYPADSPENMKKLATAEGWDFPFCYDETQDVAKAFQAACTPDFYVFDEDRKLVYRGQLDDSRPSLDAPVTGRDLRRALDLALGGEAMPEGEQKPSMGCNIKWKKGREPAYF